MYPFLQETCNIYGIEKEGEHSENITDDTSEASPEHNVKEKSAEYNIIKATQVCCLTEDQKNLINLLKIDISI